MLHLELSNEEQDLLMQILESELPKLEVEIERTDSLDFKELLKRRRATLKSLMAKIAEPLHAHA